MSDLTEWTNEDLLRELIKRNGTFPAPQSRMPMPRLEVLIGIGRDHHCFIAINHEDLAALKGQDDE